MKTIALVDHSTEGHHFSYLCIFSQTLLKLGHKVLIIVPLKDIKKVDSWVKNNVADYYSNLRTHPYDLQVPHFNWMGKYAHTAKVFHKWRKLNSRLRQIAKREKIDHVFLAFLDDYIANYLPPSLIDRVFRYKWSGLYFHPKHMRLDEVSTRSKTSFTAIDGVFSSRKCKGIGIHDEGIVSNYAKRIGKKVVLFPEMADETPPELNNPVALKITKLADGRIIVGMFGALQPHQGVMGFLKLIDIADSNKFYFVLAGPLKYELFVQKDQDVLKKFVESPPENCYLHFDYLQEGSEFNTYIDLVDVIYMIYHNFTSSSNRLTKAAIFNKPVLSSDRHCVGEDVEKYELGVTVKEGNVEQAYEGLKKLRLLIEENKLNKDNFKTYALKHSQDRLIENFQELITEPK